MDKIKCIRTENGTIIPIHNIAIISDENLVITFGLMLILMQMIVVLN